MLFVLVALQQVEHAHQYLEHLFIKFNSNSLQDLDSKIRSHANVFAENAAIARAHTFPERESLRNRIGVKEIVEVATILGHDCTRQFLSMFSYLSRCNM
jgi:hypothetical protein